MIWRRVARPDSTGPKPSHAKWSLPDSLILFFSPPSPTARCFEVRPLEFSFPCPRSWPRGSWVAVSFVQTWEHRAATMGERTVHRGGVRAAGGCLHCSNQQSSLEPVWQGCKMSRNFLHFLRRVPAAETTARTRQVQCAGGVHSVDGARQCCVNEHGCSLAAGARAAARLRTGAAACAAVRPLLLLRPVAAGLQPTAGAGRPQSLRVVCGSRACGRGNLCSWIHGRRLTIGGGRALCTHAGISRDSLHKRRATGGRKKAWRKKKK